MKKMLVIFALLMIPFSMAISTDMKVTYKPGETAIFTIQGNILEPIFSGDLKFLRDGHIEIPFDYDIKKINGKYYIYMIMPSNVEENSSSDYTFLIRDLATTVNGQNQNIDFMQNFSVSGELIDYSITPGIVSSSDNFEIEVNLNRDLDKSIEVSPPFQREVLLKPGKNTIRFDISDVSGGFYEINFGDYLLPVSIIKETKGQIFPFKFSPFEIESTILKGTDKSYPFDLIYTGEGDAIVDFSYNSQIFDIAPAFPEFFEPGKLYEFNLNVKNPGRDIDEVIILDYGGDSFNFPVRVLYTENESVVGTPYLDNNPDNKIEHFCSELKGNECSSSQICSGDVVSTKDVEKCCLATCSETSSTSYSWVGYLIGFVLLLILGFVGFRYFKSKKQGDVIKEKINKGKIVPVI